MNQKQKIKNSIRAYVIGDALGVPYEFRNKGTFNCTDFVGFQTHHQPPGTWSDDTSVLLCLLDALSSSKDLSKARERYKKNLVAWVKRDMFTCDQLFDIGNQTSSAIYSNFEQKGRDKTKMGNGALFYSLPLSLLFLKDTSLDYFKVFEDFCSVTHNNTNCFLFGLEFGLQLKDLFLSLSTNKVLVQPYSNRGDVINTYHLVFDQFYKLKDKDTSLFEDLCETVNLGQDTDTNAAFVGALLGTQKEVEKEDWKKVRKHEYVDEIIDFFLEKFES